MHEIVHTYQITNAIKIAFLTEGEDYIGLTSLPLTFPANSLNGTKIFTNITIIDDSILEPLQSFAIVLTTTDSDVVILNGRQLINIVANDGKTQL